MDRKDWVWVVVKGFGVYLGVETLLMLPSILMILSSSGGSGAGVLGLFSSFFIKAALSVYFLKSGRLVLGLIGSGA